MSSPSDAQPPVEPERRVQPSTQEIPVVQSRRRPRSPPPSRPRRRPRQLPAAPGSTPLPHPGAVSPVPVAMDQPQPTGPVDFVPGLPGTPPVPPPAAVRGTASRGPARRRRARRRSVWPATLDSDDETGRPQKRRPHRGARATGAALLGVGLAVLSLVLLEAGSGPRLRRGVLLVGRPAVVGVRHASAPSSGCWPSRSPTRRARGLRSSAVWRIAAGGLVGLAVFWLLVVLPVVASDRGFLLTAALARLGAALWVGPRPQGLTRRPGRRRRSSNCSASRGRLDVRRWSAARARRRLGSERWTASVGSSPRSAPRAGSSGSATGAAAVVAHRRARPATVVTRSSRRRPWRSRRATAAPVTPALSRAAPSPARRPRT